MRGVETGRGGGAGGGYSGVTLPTGLQAGSLSESYSRFTSSSSESFPGGSELASDESLSSILELS